MNELNSNQNQQGSIPKYLTVTFMGVQKNLLLISRDNDLDNVSVRYDDLKNELDELAAECESPSEFYTLMNEKINNHGFVVGKL